MRRSGIQGRGVFAVQPIPEGKRVVEYTGERITPRVADARYPDDTKGRHHTFLFAVSNRVVIDARAIGNDARYINHSCAPNCESIVERSRIFIYAMRDIDVGEELSYDYALIVDGPFTKKELRRLYPCKCRSKACRGTLARFA